MKIKQYVLGFAFNADKSKVLLILKKRPEWQAGLLNGVGGKIEQVDLSPEHAMIREFKEEVGIQTYAGEWQQFATMTFPNDYLGGTAIVHCFRNFTTDLAEAQRMTDESPLFCEIDTLFNGDWDSVPHLNVLIPMALDHRFVECSLTIK